MGDDGDGAAPVRDGGLRDGTEVGCHTAPVCTPTDNQQGGAVGCLYDGFGRVGETDAVGDVHLLVLLVP